jgi:hypothetical protein
MDVFRLRAEEWVKEKMRARLVPGVCQPDLTFFVRSLSFLDSSGLVRFEFPAAPRMAVWVAPADQVCGWTLTGSTIIRRPFHDGFAALRSPDGSHSVDIWQHLGIVAFDRGPWVMPYSMWVHHQYQLEAITDRATDSIQVVNKPNHEPDDPFVLPSDRQPGDLPKLPPAPPDPPGAKRVRGRLQVELGYRLVTDKPLPDIDFYISEIDFPHKRATFRFTAAADLSVVAKPDDIVGGWTVKEFRADAADPSEAEAVLQPWGEPGSIELWKRLAPPKPGDVLRMSQAKWERHRYEPDLERLRAEGRVVVTDDPAASGRPPRE